MENMLKLSERILEDFPWGGRHEKVFRGIFTFWFCAIVILLIFIVKYIVTPPEFQVVNAEYIEDAVDEYSVNVLYKIDETTGIPDGVPFAERKIYEDDSWRTAK